MNFTIITKNIYYEQNEKMAYLFAAVSLLSSCNYDDSQLWDAVNKQEERISILENGVKR